MKPQSLKRAAVLLLLLLALWGAMQALDRVSGRRSGLWEPAPRASKLLLRKGAEEVSLVKGEGDSWKLQKPFVFPADSAAVRQLLEKLARAQLSEALSTNPARHAHFQVDGSSAIVLQAYLQGDTPALHLHVGRQGVDFDTVFIRRQGEDAVYEARGLARYELDKAPGAWADKLVCSMATDQITSLELRGLKSDVRLLRSGASWTLNGVALSSKTVAGKIEPALTALARLEADGVSEDDGAFKKSELKVLVRRARLETPALELEIGPKSAQNMHPARRAGSAEILYQFAPWRLEALQEAAKIASPSDKSPGKLNSPAP